MKVRQTFLGYAMAQLKRIQTHRGWLLNPPRQRPARREFGLPDGPTLTPDDRDRIEKVVAEKVRAYALETVDLPRAARIAVEERLGEFWRDAFVGHADDLDGPAALRAVATKAVDLPRDVAEALEAERRYRAAARHWEAYEAWKAGRNPVRADLERRHGYDTKHAMHLLRLMRTGLEALESGELRVRRPDADELNAIRDGSMTFDELLHEAGALREKVEEAARRGALPLDIDQGFVEGLLEELVAGRVNLSSSVRPDER
jgi:predicted nucleotidyltransferase